MVNTILLAGATCILVAIAVWCLVLLARNLTATAAPSDSDERIAGYSASLAAASETASRAVLSLGQLLESQSPLLPTTLSGVTPEIMDLLDTRLVGVFQANVDLQDRLSSAETLIRKQQADIERARREACTDSLTGLPNRRGLQDELQAAFDDSPCGDGDRLYFLMMDLDHFKQINDNLGHPAGDRVLKVVADSLRRSIADVGGTVARCGGEEFSAFLRCDSQDELARLTRALLADVSAAGSASLDSRHAVTISVGAAAWDGVECVETLSARADRALYRAKWYGRNRAYYHNGRHAVPLGDDEEPARVETEPASHSLDERRQAQRRPLSTVHRVAFQPESGMESDAEFQAVMCVDISTKGLAFLSATEPSSDGMLVDFSDQQGPTIFARIVSCQPVADDLWRVACRFVRRVKPSEPFGDTPEAPAKIVND